MDINYIHSLFLKCKSVSIDTRKIEADSLFVAIKGEHFDANTFAEEALEKGTIICYLLSDAAQIELWPTVKKYLTPGKSLYFSHGFGITYKEKTGIVPPADVDVFLAAPKGSGTSLRRLFVAGKG